MIKPDEIKLIVGLGNPGREYRATYHNAGRLAVEYLARRIARPFTRRVRDQFEYLRAGQTILLTPLTFMNESGGPTAQALAFFKIKPRELLLVHDESDLPLGEFKFAFGRGAAGHHGVESVIDRLGTKEFFRLRIGIRRNKKARADEFVLQNIRPQDLILLYGVFGATVIKLIENESPAGVGRISESGRVTD